MAWTRVASPAQAGQQTIVAVGGAGQGGSGEIALYWIDGAVCATANICTHAYARLPDGVLAGDGIECPVHQALFNVRSGEAMAGPATDPLRTDPCRIEGDDIRIDM